MRTDVAYRHRVNGDDLETVQPNMNQHLVDLLAPGASEIDVHGPRLSFVTTVDDEVNKLCVMRGVLPPGAVVPLHAHDDFEGFLVVSGGHEVLVDGPDGMTWQQLRPGQFVNVPPGVLHAHRNLSDQDAVDLVVTTPTMGRFFRDVGRPVNSSPPTPADLQLFVETAARYGYQLGTAAQNAAVGIDLPPG